MSNGAAALNTAPKRRLARLVMVAYLLFLMIPIYWLIAMSFKPNAEI